VVNKRLLEKLSVATVPADALKTTRHLLKIVVKDATFAAHGLTKDALNHIKTHIIDIMPYLLLSAVTTNVSALIMIINLSTTSLSNSCFITILTSSAVES
jgi:hypothetical protein